MKEWLSREDAEAGVSGADGVELIQLFAAATGCDAFDQRVLVVAPGAVSERLEPADDEVLYVLEGEGVLRLAGEEVALRPGVGVHVAAGVPWAVEAASRLELQSVLVRDPEPAPAPGRSVVDLAEAARGVATGARTFTMGVWHETGCASVTQFIGHIPPGRAPDHFHEYDEVIYVLNGTGVLHIGGEERPLGPGAAIHLPRTLVHCLENTGEGEMDVLGIFRPSGSPAEAYYPDGTPAPYPGATTDANPEGAS